MSRELDARQEGQLLVIAALAMVLLVGLLALAIDGGNAYAQRRAMQNAADAAALAGAHALRDGGNVQAAIYEYAGRNGVDGPANIAWSYIDEEEEHVGVVATTTITFSTFFAGVLDVPSMSASASAAARLVGGSSFDWALFAANLNEDQAISVDGNGVRVEGNIHSNGGIYINGNNTTVDGGTESVRYFSLDGNNNTLGSPFELTESGGYKVSGGNNSYPAPSYTANAVEVPQYNLSDYGPGKPDWVHETDWHYHSGNWSFSQNNKTLTGLYYVEGNITLSGNNLSGHATFVATGNITLDANNYSFTTYDDKLVLFAGGNAEISGNSTNLSGIVYAPQGEVKINGNHRAINGGVIAGTISINGNNGNIVSDSSYFEGEQSIRLVR